ncbi:MAG: phosphate signaling complex protein PhoU [Chloroflexi bacterium]|nr:MAG: phosphate signaling complex protein PhoU [Chloroflexota bacterium]
MHNISPRETFDRALQQLLDEVMILGSMVEQAVIEAVDSLKRRDFEASKRIYQNDKLVNLKRYEIEQKCLTLIATQQPMARDLRLLAAILEIITELERIGDYAKGIARINLLIGEEPLVKPLIDIPRMAEIGLDMLRRSLTAFMNRDAAEARIIPDSDDEIDNLYNQVYTELLEIIIKDPSVVDRANHLLWAAHNLERMADRVTNICERIVFVQTGEILEMDQSDDELIIGDKKI